uniref:SPK domain-containing protein n=1 Tax=Strongyloides venezuelensis TaxID=75913 RepID=A0A0K0F1E0_STRVS
MLSPEMIFYHFKRGNKHTNLNRLTEDQKLSIKVLFKMNKKPLDDKLREGLFSCNRFNNYIVNCKIIVGNISYEIVSIRDKFDRCLKSLSNMIEILTKMQSLNSERIKVIERYMETCSSGDQEVVDTDQNPSTKDTEVQFDGCGDIGEQLPAVSSQLSSISFNKPTIEPNKIPSTSVSETQERSVSPDYNLNDSRSEWSEDVYHQCDDVKLYVNHKGTDRGRINLGKVTYTFKEYQEKKFLQVKLIEFKEKQDIFFDCITDSENFHLFYRDDYAIIKLRPCTVANCSPHIKSFALKFYNKQEGSSVYKHILRKPFSMD